MCGCITACKAILTNQIDVVATKKARLDGRTFSLIKVSFYSATTSNSTSECCPLPKSIEAL